MFSHYLKIAFRNLRKYKMQTIISVIGLAVGFVCFALSALWLRYERSFDTFHPNARNMYVITLPDFSNPHSFSQPTPRLLAEYLRATFPEVKNAAHTGLSHSHNMIWNGREIKVSSITVSNPSIFDFFNIRVLQGHLDFGTFAQSHIAISASKSRRLFGDKNPIGETFNYSKIVAVVSDLARPSNFQFDVIHLTSGIGVSWRSRSGSTIIELHPNINKEAFFDRLRNHTVERGEYEWHHITGMDVIPLTRMRYQDPNVQAQRNVKYEHILLFSLIGLLVILCSLFNYFTLFFSRFRIRKKEFALRMVCGASFKSLFSLLATEFLTIMLFASVFGLLLTNLFQPIFLELSEIDLPLSAIFGEILLYWLGIILLALFSFFVLLLIFRKRSLNASIRKSKNTISRKTSVVVQLIISIFFAFCTIVMIKQLNDLTRPGNLGFDFQNTASFSISISADAPSDIRPDAMTLYHQLMQMPGIDEVLINFTPLLPRFWHITSRNISDWEGKRADDEGFDIEVFRVSEAFINFYRLQLVEGEFLMDYDTPDFTVLINEAAKRRLGWTEAVGKTFTRHTVKGVIRDLHTNSPTLSANPALYSVHRGGITGNANVVIFRYQGVSFFDIQNRIEAFFAEEFPDNELWEFNDAEAAFAEFIQSERALMRLLGFVSIICILISVFGFFSLVSLTCEERRKEIAIRKINGATIHDIVGIFFKEYSLLLAIGALIAFPTGYYIMRRWLEQYVIQTSIDAWIYAAILLALTLVIVLCVGWRVWKASVENPADVVKSE